MSLDHSLRRVFTSVKHNSIIVVLSFGDVSLIG